MRGFIALLISVLAAIGLGIGVEAAVGTYESGAQQVVQQSVSSLDSSRYLQLQIVMSASGPESKSNAFIGQVVGAFSIGVDMSSNTSAPLSGATLADEGLDIFIAEKGSHYADVRLAAGRLYVKANLSDLAHTFPFSAADRKSLIQANPLLGNRWFELPQSIMSSFLKDISKSQASKPSASATTEGQQFLQAFESAVKDNGSVSMRQVSNGEQDFHASVQLQGFLRQFANAAVPLIEKSTSELPRLGVPSVPANAFSSVSGNLSGDLFTTRSNQLQRVEADYSSPNLGLDLMIAVAHQAVSVGVPGGSTLLPQSIINGIRQGVKVPALS